MLVLVNALVNASYVLTSAVDLNRIDAMYPMERTQESNKLPNRTQDHTEEHVIRLISIKTSYRVFHLRAFVLYSILFSLYDSLKRRNIFKVIQDQT